MRKLFMCRPTHFEVSYDINPWMSGQAGKVDADLAMQQWLTLVDRLSRQNVVHILDGVQGLPDLVFTANAGLAKGKVAILSKFSKAERQGEEEYFRSWFESQGLQVFQPTLPYEGEGDHLIDSQDRHWLGTGFRTDKAVAPELEGVLKTTINTLELVDPRWYHLDTCFCPLPDGEIMWYPGAFSLESQQLIRDSFTDHIEVTEEDALMFCCNAVCLGTSVYLPINKTATFSLIKNAYNVHEFDLSEFLKAGGAAKCLVLVCDI